MTWPDFDALAKIVVVALAGTFTVIPAPSKSVALPAPRAPLEQVSSA